MAKVKNAPASGVRCSARLDLGGFQDLFLNQLCNFFCKISPQYSLKVNSRNSSSPIIRKLIYLLNFI
jgi:hypothetical protein